jgi:hypothetical protein
VYFSRIWQTLNKLLLILLPYQPSLYIPIYTPDIRYGEAVYILIELNRVSQLAFVSNFQTQRIMLIVLLTFFFLKQRRSGLLFIIIVYYYYYYLIIIARHNRKMEYENFCSKKLSLMLGRHLYINYYNPYNLHYLIHILLFYTYIVVYMIQSGLIFALSLCAHGTDYARVLFVYNN